MFKEASAGEIPDYAGIGKDIVTLAHVPVTGGQSPEQSIVYKFKISTILVPCPKRPYKEALLLISAAQINGR